MKEKFLLLSVALLLFAGNGWCYTIEGDIDVGLEDFFIAAIKIAEISEDNNGISTKQEQDWVQSVLNALSSENSDQEWYIKDETVSYYSAIDDEGNAASNVFAFQIDNVTDDTGDDEYADEDADYSGYYADYYIIKNSTYIALFKNLESLDWGVFDVTDIVIDGVNISELMKLGNDEDSWVISHVTSFQDSDISVVPATAQAPEPATMILFGFGLIGLAGIGRCKTKK